MFHKGILSHLKSTGRDSQWLRYMVGRGYEDTEVVGEYKIQYDETEQDVRILIWNPSTPCMVLAIDKTGDKTGSLDVVHFDAKCTIDGKMKRGDGTRKMLQFGLDLAKQKGATQISLTDNSTITCEGKTIDLPGMYFLKYGMTWYEKYFGFQPAERFRKSYDNAKEMRLKYLDTETLGQLECNSFTDENIQECLAHIRFTNFYKFEWVKSLALDKGIHRSSGVPANDLG
jgi:hypothetical protein